jgi:hypothetical protein
MNAETRDRIRGVVAQAVSSAMTLEAYLETGGDDASAALADAVKALGLLGRAVNILQEEAK